jgi:phosphatidylinositol alpha-1,6-mannosyltransferase
MNERGARPNETRAVIWFVTRKYPPRIGGMERSTWELTTRMATRREVRVIALRSGSAWLPFFLAGAAFSIASGALAGRIKVLHLGDAVLAPLGCLAKWLGVPASVTVRGLDVTYTNPIYRIWLLLFFRNLDAYVCLSRSTRAAAIRAGAPERRTSIIGNGVTPATTVEAARQADLLLFVGRLVRRKGLEWFVQEVLPKVAQHREAVRLAVIGAGPERGAIRTAAVRAGVADRIDWLGAVTDAERNLWLSRAAICIAPNVHVPGDMEGFGNVALEAAASGCALIAADLEGLRDAIVDGQGGRLVASEDADAWTTAISDLLEDPTRAAALGARARAWAWSERDWESVCDRYSAMFDATAAAHAARGPGSR